MQNFIDGKTVKKNLDLKMAKINTSENKALPKDFEKVRKF